MTVKPASVIEEFTGFPDETFRFLGDLAANNDRDWFRANRDRYDAFWLDPARRFVAAAGVALQEIAPVEARPKVNGSIFRVDRDTRFSRDKRPYKDHFDVWFWEGDRPAAVSGFYLRLTADGVGIGVGAHTFDRDRLAAYRRAVVDRRAGAELVDAVAAVETAPFRIHGETYKTHPRDFVADDPFKARMLRHSALWAGCDGPAPRVVGTRRFLRWATARWEKLALLHRWLVDNVQ